MTRVYTRRRFQALLAVGVVGSLAGCGDTEGPGDPADPETPGEEVVGEGADDEGDGPGDAVPGEEPDET